MLFSIFGIIGDKDDDCLLLDEEIKFRVKQSTTIRELNNLYSSIHEKQQEQFKDLFSERKREILENTKKDNESILNTTEIKEG